jgi:DNA modification methylase
VKLHPHHFEPENTTVWSFPERGNWATHSGKFRGNFAPQIARNLIINYTSEGDFVLDPMVGSGTTLIEAKLLNRNALGIDINPKAVELSNQALDFENQSKTNQRAKPGNAKDLSDTLQSSVDLIILHPPYLNIIKYSNGTIAEDLSNISRVDRFCDEIEAVAREMKRVLKPNKHCAVLIGDTRKSRHYVPLSHYVMERFLNVGFVLKEEIIKMQHNCSSTNRWTSSANKRSFYLIMHEHLFVFRNPQNDENLSKVKWSLKVH